MADIQWLIGGEAGYGIMTTGALMARVFTRIGMSVFDYVEYPSLIRGGHNAYYVRASDETIYSQKRTVDILVALNRETIDLHKHELVPGSVVMYDPTLVKITEGEFAEDIHNFPIPFVALCKEVGANRLMMNTMSVGASLALFSSEYVVLQDILTDMFGRKGEQVVKENVDTTKAGFAYIQKNYAGKFAMQMQKKPQESLFIGGADAIALGAIRAGVKFVAMYPMTPVNAIMTTMTAHALKYNIVTKEPEDEIAAINMAIGASYAGVRAMTASAGGGFSLMVEALGLAAQTETPLVVIEGMRPGPATGMPTWTDQADLRFVLHAAQGEFPRVVMAPGDAKECFSMIMDALNIADKYQMLVIILADKYLLEGHMSVAIKDINAINDAYVIDRGKMLTDDEAAKQEKYKRFLLTDDGISPRSIPGQKGGIALTGSDEHDEMGLYNEEIDNRNNMMDKRFKKLEIAATEVKPLELIGPSDAPLTLIAFGSTKMTILDAMETLKKEGIHVNLLKIHLLNPFPSEVVGTFIRNAQNSMVLELNKMGQLEGLIREHTGLTIPHHFRKYDGRPFYPEEIIAEVKKIIRT